MSKLNFEKIDNVGYKSADQLLFVFSKEPPKISDGSLTHHLSLGAFCCTHLLNGHQNWCCRYITRAGTADGSDAKYLIVREKKKKKKRLEVKAKSARRSRD